MPWVVGAEMFIRAWCGAGEVEVDGEGLVEGGLGLGVALEVDVEIAEVVEVAGDEGLVEFGVCGGELAADHEAFLEGVCGLAGPLGIAIEDAEVVQDDGDLAAVLWVCTGEIANGGERGAIDRFGVAEAILGVEQVGVVEGVLEGVGAVLKGEAIVFEGLNGLKAQLEELADLVLAAGGLVDLLFLLEEEVGQEFLSLCKITVFESLGGIAAERVRRRLLLELKLELIEFANPEIDLLGLLGKISAGAAEKVVEVIDGAGILREELLEGLVERSQGAGVDGGAAAGHLHGDVAAAGVDDVGAAVAGGELSVSARRLRAGGHEEREGEKADGSHGFDLGAGLARSGFAGSGAVLAGGGGGLPIWTETAPEPEELMFGLWSPLDCWTTGPAGGPG